MKASIARGRKAGSTVSMVGAAFVLAATMGGMAIYPVSADEHGHRDGDHRGHGDHGDEHRGHDHDRGNWRGGYGYGRHDWRGAPVYEPYPVYAPPPVYYAPEPEPGISLFFPIEIH